MSDSEQTIIGSVVSLWRYPVKSMLGEELDTTQITERGLVGDRAYAVVDKTDGKVATAKNPRKWPRLFDCRATFEEARSDGAAIPRVRITLPDGRTVASDQSDRSEILSEALERNVTLQSAGSNRQDGIASVSEEYWPDMEGLDHRDTVTDFELPDGTFFDMGTLHLLTMATLERLRKLYPLGLFEIPRFRPNVVLETVDGSNEFVENRWVGQTLVIGEEVCISVTEPCPRCVMTTLPQNDLPKDVDILRTAVKHNHANVGVYASVVRGGTVRLRDSVRME